MKKLLIIAFVVLLVLVGSVLWVLRGMGVSDPALLLPAETVAVASLPDLPRSLFRWPHTTLAKMGVEPQVKAFLEQPLKYLTKQKGGDEAAGVLVGLKPGRIFAASVNVSERDAAILIGFQYWGGKPAHDAAVARLREEISAGSPAPELKHETYQGADIAASTHGPVTIYNASHGQWGFISNNLPALKAALDRAAGRLKEGSLAESARYKQVLSHLPKEPDFLVYLQPQSFLDALLVVGQNFGAQGNLEQIEQLRKVEAVGITMKLDGANLRDTLFVLRPAPQEGGTLTHNSIKFTTKTTTAFIDSVVNFGHIGDFAPLLAGTDLPISQLLQLIPEAFGPEAAVSLTWPEGQLTPTGLLALAVQNPGKASEAFQEILTLFPTSTFTELGGLKFYSFPELGNLAGSPTVALGDGHLFAGLDPAVIDRTLQASKSGETLENSPTFVPLKEAYRSANETFVYLDTRAIFERAYPFVRQILPFAAAMNPRLSEVVDPAKLPNVETIAKHLSPITYTQTRLPDGYLAESAGPITLTHVGLIAVGIQSSFSQPRGQ
jgi:hypothetical protein